MPAIYLVKTPSGNRLIKASTQASAINFAVKSTVTAESLTATELAEHLATGLKIEEAAKPQPEQKE